MPNPLRKKNTEVTKPEVAPVAESEVAEKKEALEKPVEVSKEVQKDEEVAEVARKAAPAQVKDDQVGILPEEDHLTEEVEDILEEDLDEMYHQLPPDKQLEFKAKGEETVGLITQMVESTKVKSGKIVGWIKGWLKLIPGVNKFFLEQEAKIKTDKILVLADEEKKKQGEKID
tara:strand:+ start:304 stop:822 length:519 start_codon:yes stop_codon:yes gene_type:complete